MGVCFSLFSTLGAPMGKSSGSLQVQPVPMFADSRGAYYGFNVTQMDETRREIATGQLCIYSLGISFKNHQHTADLYWPLHCLRRYGCSERTFSFESDNQCETGAGQFSFRSRCAKEINKILGEMLSLEKRRSATPKKTDKVGKAEEFDFDIDKDNTTKSTPKPPVNAYLEVLNCDDNTSIDCTPVTTRHQLPRPSVQYADISATPAIYCSRSKENSESAGVIDYKNIDIKRTLALRRVLLKVLSRKPEHDMVESNNS